MRFRPVRGATVAAALTIAALAAAAPAGAGFTEIGVLGSGSGTGAGQLDGPYRADVGPDGSVYVVDRTNVRIVKFGPGGAFERAWGKGVNPLTAGTGFEVCTTSCVAGADGSAAGEMNFLWDVAVAPNGLSVYVSDYFNRRINQYDPDGTFVRAWGWDVIPGGGPGFEVCTTGLGCKAGTIGGGAGQLDRPGGLGVGPGGDVYVTESMNDRVSRFAPGGAFVAAWGADVDPAGGTGFEVCTTTCKTAAPGTVEGGLSNPFALGVSDAGDVFAGGDSGFVNRYSLAGAYLGRFGGPGGGDGALTSLRSIDVGPTGEVLVTQSSPKGVWRFRSDFAFLETFSPSQSVIDAASDAAFAPDGTVYVPQFQSLTDRVVHYALSPVAGPPPVTPPPPATPQPAPQPAPPPPAPALAVLPKASSVIVLPSARVCVSRRNFRIRLKQPKGFKLKSAYVNVNGKRAATVTGKRVTAPVDLRGLPKGRFTVRISVTLTDGRKLASTRAYRTCAPKRR